MEDLTDLERAVLHQLLEGGDPVRRALREQVVGAGVLKREFTGVGFFTYFSLNGAAESVEVPNGFSPLGGVSLKADNLRHGAGFILFLKDGKVNFLEGFTYDEPWPDDLGRYSVVRDASAAP